MIAFSYTFDDFEKDLHDCLLHLYDYTFLQDHRLLRYLARQESGVERVQAFRRIVNTAIDELRPETGISSQSRAGRTYHILMLRFREQQPPLAVANYLALGERQFYRESNRALRSLSLLIWQISTGETLENVESERNTEEDQVTLKTEVSRAHLPDPGGTTHVALLLGGVAEAVRSFADQRRVQFFLDKSPDEERDVVTIQTDRTLLRQALLIILNDAINGMNGGGIVRLSFATNAAQREIEIRIAIQSESIKSIVTSLTEQQPLAYLLDTISGKIQIEAGIDGLMVRLGFALSPNAILIVDDNESVGELYRRYLRVLDCSVFTIQRGDDVLDFVRMIRPKVIVLDIMLPGPGRDGWEVMQVLKHHPDTKDIPIAVCSILEVQSLSESLGAEHYFRKMPDPEQFVETLRQYVE